MLDFIFDDSARIFELQSKLHVSPVISCLLSFCRRNLYEERRYFLSLTPSDNETATTLFVFIRRTFIYKW